jgi:hypothetical protein
MDALAQCWTIWPRTIGATCMAAQEKVASTPQWKTANWQRYRHQRVLILWEVVALSLGAEPDSKNVAAARKDVQFQEAYLQRVKSLTRMMSAVPDAGHVTYFPWHVYNEDKPLARNRMVDVVSCIDKLVMTEGDGLPTEFVALRESLNKIPIPKEPPRNTGLVLAPSIVVATGSTHADSTADGNKLTDGAAKKKDQSKAIAAKESEQIAAMFFAVVCDAYGYDSTSDISLKLTVDAIEKALQMRGILGRYGLSDKKIKEALRVGKEACPQPQT